MGDEIGERKPLRAATSAFSQPCDMKADTPCNMKTERAKVDAERGKTLHALSDAKSMPTVARLRVARLKAGRSQLSHCPAEKGQELTRKTESPEKRVVQTV